MQNLRLSPKTQSGQRDIAVTTDVGRDYPLDIPTVADNDRLPVTEKNKSISADVYRAAWPINPNRDCPKPEVDREMSLWWRM